VEKDRFKRAKVAEKGMRRGKTALPLYSLVGEGLRDLLLLWRKFCARVWRKGQ